MKTTALRLLSSAVTALALATVAAQAEPQPTEIDGQWTGRLSRDAQQGWGIDYISADLFVSEGRVQLDLISSGWMRAERDECQYVASGERIDGPVRRNPASSSADCPEMDLHFARLDGERGALVIAPAGGERIEMTLRADSRPPLQGETDIFWPQSYDVLGVHPGMTLTQAEKMLIGKHGFTAERIQAGEIPSIKFERDRDGVADDIVLLLEAGPAGPGSEVVAVRRRSEMDRGKTFSLTTLRSALEQKYGPMFGQESDVWLRDRQGNAIAAEGNPSELCAGTTYPRPVYFLGFGGMAQEQIAPACGAQIIVRGHGDRQTGEVYNYLMLVVDPVAAWQADWDSEANPRERIIDKTLKLLTPSESDAVPEL
ncbi:hypothetical protein [Tranquillimonas alkanivorans]|uniref:META domain-containing protein n=1 Tax=Tranquillimonas alkanivorans TaxID=441119 RepID=A0A1I5TVE8_9RHOB|nr:hypothetical protein [Tranquillimonas alkanivorans]SFP86989.1 hypothetical protein SAMN04488047_11547 [Tranquillimonas alkanivorans]